MDETSPFHYARIAAQAEERLLKLFDGLDTDLPVVAEHDRMMEAYPANEEDAACAG
jgi:hypothetical protein